MIAGLLANGMTQEYIDSIFAVYSAKNIGFEDPRIGTDGHALRVLFPWDASAHSVVLVFLWFAHGHGPHEGVS